jgi:hypothetical protein
LASNSSSPPRDDARVDELDLRGERLLEVNADLVAFALVPGGEHVVERLGVGHLGSLRARLVVF